MQRRYERQRTEHPARYCKYRHRGQNRTRIDRVTQENFDENKVLFAKTVVTPELPWPKRATALVLSGCEIPGPVSKICPDGFHGDAWPRRQIFAPRFSDGCSRH